MNFFCLLLTKDENFALILFQMKQCQVLVRKFVLVEFGQACLFSMLGTLIVTQCNGPNELYKMLSSEFVQTAFQKPTSQLGN